MEKAPDFVSGDCEFESRRGRLYLFCVFYQRRFEYILAPDIKMLAISLLHYSI